MDAKRIKIYLDYKDIKNASLAGFATIFVFLRDCLDKEHFEESLIVFNNYSLATSKLLKFIKAHIKSDGKKFDKEEVERIMKHPDYLKFKKSIEEEKEKE